MRHHNFSTFVASEPGIIPEEMHYPQYLRVWYAVTQLGSASAANIVKWIRNSNATLKETEIRIQLDALTVNSNSRYRYLGSRKTHVLTKAIHTTCCFVQETYEIHGMNCISKNCTVYGILVMMGKRQFRLLSQGHMIG